MDIKTSIRRKSLAEEVAELIKTTSEVEIG